MNEANGKVNGGGVKVLFTNDRRFYLAIDQPDGMDRSEWKIYTADSGLRWSGDSVIEDSITGHVDANLSVPIWSPVGELTATATCTTAKKQNTQVKLVKAGENWEWAPHPQCAVK